MSGNRSELVCLHAVRSGKEPAYGRKPLTRLFGASSQARSGLPGNAAMAGR